MKVPLGAVGKLRKGSQRVDEDREKNGNTRIVSERENWGERRR